MLSCTLLLKLPADWQTKMHNEITSKLNLCITDIDTAKNVADQTWRYLSHDNIDKNQLSLNLKPYLLDHASDFTEWVMDFAQKTLEYYLETISSNNIKNDTKTMDENVNDLKVNEDKNRESKSRMFKNAIRDVSNQKTKEKKEVDPLDETLDNLIKKEKIAKLQGQTAISLGVQTKSGKFKPETQQELNNRKKLKTKASFFKNLTLVNVGNESKVETQESSKPVTKVPKLCMNFPNCQFGPNCRYVHPDNKICKNWPNCFFGEKCAFIHPSN